MWVSFGHLPVGPLSVLASHDRLHISRRVRPAVWQNFYAASTRVRLTRCCHSGGGMRRWRRSPLCLNLSAHDVR
jgi:hypothetical protein